MVARKRDRESFKTILPLGPNQKKGIEESSSYCKLTADFFLVISSV